MRPVSNPGVHPCATVAGRPANPRGAELTQPDVGADDERGPSR